MASKHIGTIITFYLIMLLSSFGSITGELLRHGYNNDYAMGYGLLITVVNILVVSIVMMIVPFSYKVIKKKLLPYKKGRKICLWNSIALFILSSVLMTVTQLGFIGGLGAVAFYFINKWLFVEQLSPHKLKSKATNSIGENDYAINAQQEPDLIIDKNSTEEAVKNIVREQEKPKVEPIVESKQHTNISKPVKRKFCSRCGGLIDNETKRCTGCGKQYFKGFKFTFSSFAIILLVILLAISIIYSLTLAQELNENAARIKELSELRASLVNKVDELTRKITNLEYEAQKNRELVDFVDDHVVFVEDDGTNWFHKFECNRFRGDYFWAYNTEKAVQLGYTPCPYCH